MMGILLFWAEIVCGVAIDLGGRAATRLSARVGLEQRSRSKILARHMADEWQPSLARGAAIVSTDNRCPSQSRMANRNTSALMLLAI